MVFYQVQRRIGGLEMFRHRPHYQVDVQRRIGGLEKWN